MRGGEPHELIENAEQAGHALKYVCLKCGEPYQVRTRAPSCRVPFLRQLEELGQHYANLSDVARRPILAELARQRLKWPRPFRDAMLEQFERWIVWRARLGAPSADA